MTITIIQPKDIDEGEPLTPYYVEGKLTKEQKAAIELAFSNNDCTVEFTESDPTANNEIVTLIERDWN